ncbi:hypothetical protein BCR42DRAFT_454948 [Absidia repens]|uniref:Mitochondrial outer membrane translocase complex, subunit Tom5 n=1 Tax=Absidia repens TaxID=90262 RepID=A0A1X2I4U7_9FUNG|nr:hypothetical protein BCR42DRAFT_454948 [Absidia repens]
MFMPQQPTLTPEQKQMLRQRTVGTLANFVIVVCAFRAAPFALDQVKRFL